MKIQAIIFDINGTLIDIETDEGDVENYRVMSDFLSYQGIRVQPWDLRDEYFRVMGEQRQSSGEVYPEFDAVELWRELIGPRLAASDIVLPPEKLKWMPLFLAEIYRSVSLRRLQLYPDVRDVLDELRKRYKLAALSDAQSAWAIPEIRAVGIHNYFNPIIVSGDLGFRKPDKRIFESALKGLGVSRKNALFVGNDMYRDVYGANQVGLKTVFFSSNQGRKTANGVEPDYIIYRFAELRQAITFLSNK